MFTILFCLLLFIIQWPISLFSKQAGDTFFAIIPNLALCFLVFLFIYSIIIANFVFRIELREFKESHTPIKLFPVFALIFFIIGTLTQKLTESTFAQELIGCILLVIIALIYLFMFFIEADDNRMNFFKLIPMFILQEIKAVVFLIITIFSLTITFLEIVLAIISWPLAIVGVTPVILRVKDLSIVRFFSEY